MATRVRTPSTYACRTAVTRKHGKQCHWRKGTGKKTCDTDTAGVLQCEKHRLAWSVHGLLRARQYQDFNSILTELVDAKGRAEKLFPGIASGARSSYALAAPRCRKTTQTVRGRRQHTARYHPYPFSIKRNHKYPLLDNLDFQSQFDCLCSKILWHLEEVSTTVEQYVGTLQEATQEVESFLR